MARSGSSIAAAIPGAGGTTCAGPSAAVNPIFQFDTSGKLLKTFGAGMFVSPHKLTVDHGRQRLGGRQRRATRSSSSSPDGKVLMTLGKRASPARASTSSMRPPKSRSRQNGDIFVGDGHTGGGTASATRAS
mgnify:CR=1 FL=1